LGRKKTKNVTIKEEILQEHSKSQMLRIVNFIGNDQKLFDELFQLVISGETKVSQRGSWPMRYCVEAHPELIVPHLGKLIENLHKPVHIAVKRNSLSILEHIEIPEEYFGVVADICFEWLDSSLQPVAIRAISMSILFNICKKIPELANELKLIIEEHMPYGTGGFVARGRKVLAGIEKLGKD